MTRARTVAFAVLFLAPLGAAGQDSKKQPAREPQQKEKEPPRLDFKSLKALLADLGLEPKVADNVFLKVRWTTPNLGAVVWVSVSGDQKTVWLYTEFALRPDYDKAPADAWRKLLEKNDEIGPSHFALDEKGRRLTLRRPVTNSSVTAALMRKELNAFVETVHATQDFWKPTAFLPAATPEDEKLLAKLAGRWKLSSSTDRGVPVPADKAAKFAFEFDRNQFRAFQDDKEVLKALVHIDTSGDTATIDLIGEDTTDVGILRLDGDTLLLCSASGSTRRPTTFASTATSNSLLMVLKRAKP